MNEAEFIKLFLAALNNEPICNKMKSMYEESIEELHQRVDALEAVNDEISERITSLEDKVDTLETTIDSLDQKERGFNLILSGEKVDPTPEAVANKLHELVGVTVKAKNIHYAVKLRAKEEKTKIVFYNTRRTGTS